MEFKTPTCTNMTKYLHSVSGLTLQANERRDLQEQWSLNQAVMQPRPSNRGTASNSTLHILRILLFLTSEPAMQLESREHSKVFWAIITENPYISYVRQSAADSIWWLYAHPTGGRHFYLFEDSLAALLHVPIYVDFFNEQPASFLLKILTMRRCTGQIKWLVHRWHIHCFKATYCTRSLLSLSFPIVKVDLG